MAVAAKKKSPPNVGHDLYVQTEAARTLLANLGDILADDLEGQRDAVEGQTNLHEAITSAVQRLVVIDTLQGGIGDLVERLKLRSDRLKAQKVQLRSALATALDQARLDHYETALATVSLKAVARQVDVTDESLVPSQFWKAQEPKLDKRAVLAALNAGEAVPGAVLDNGGSTVSLRTK